MPRPSPDFSRRVHSPIKGAFVGFDSTGFSLGTPQIYLQKVQNEYSLMMWYVPGAWNTLDGGHTFDELPIQFVGPWGFGGYYEDHPSFYITDVDGNEIPAFAGYYCALRLNTAPDR